MDIKAFFANKRNLALVLVAAVLIITGGGFLLNRLGLLNMQSVEVPKGIILFYGNGCPHCQQLEEFLTDHKINERVSHTKLEVFENESNAQILLETARRCKISDDQIGVPFLWDGEKCYLGYPDVEKFFRDQLVNG